MILQNRKLPDRENVFCIKDLVFVGLLAALKTYSEQCYLGTNPTLSFLSDLSVRSAVVGKLKIEQYDRLCHG